MMKKMFLIAFVLLSGVAIAQTTISGTISDATGPLPGANIKISRKAVGTTTDFDGNFTLKVTDKPPFTLEISSLGYQTKKVEITKNNQIVTLTLKENATALDEVVISASRTPERVMESPVTIERFDTRAIKNSSSPSFYGALENLKGVDVNSSGLNFKSVNTRGFATFSNERFVQLVDGMDNSSPALNFALGNLLGMSELDVKSVEVLPGAASALYGANAFNGIMLMRSKNPFDDQGISVVFKTGITSQQAAGNNPFYDAGIRMAYAFSDYFAAKATLSYLTGEEWHATDYRNSNGVGGVLLTGTRDSKKNYDGVNVYGDEAKYYLGDAIGTVSRTGYNENDLIDYETKSIKFGASLNYRPWGNDRLEIIWNSKYGTGNTIYQGLNRYSLKNFFMEQHKLEFRGKNFFIRGYYTGEDAGDSFDSRFAALNINRAWKSDQDWFQQYAAAYLGAVPNVTASSHAAARAFADRGRFVPGTSAFQKAFNDVTNNPDLVTGSKFQDETSLYHADANLNLQDYISWAEIQVGGSYRQYNLNSFGTIYTDGSGPIKYSEYGVYTQLQKKFLEDRLKFTGSVRFDKSQNFEGSFSPRVSLAYAAGENKNHNFRASFQTGFRNPTTQDQYIGLDSGAGVLIGTVEDNLDRFVSAPIRYSSAAGTMGLTGTTTFTGRQAYNNSFTASSVTDFSEGKIAAPEKANFDLVKPEKVQSVEIGYRGVLPTGDNRLSVDFNAYYNSYTDFIASINTVTPLYGVVGSSEASSVPGVTQGQLAMLALRNGDYAGVQFDTNSETDVTSYGIGLALNTKIFNGYNVGLNYTWSKFNFDDVKYPDFEPGFNTPEHKVKFQFGHTNLFKNFGFNLNLRWQTEYEWQSSFLDATIPSRTLLDAQVNYKVPSIKSVFKVGGANLTGQEYLTAPGIGAIGSQYYISWTINN